MCVTLCFFVIARVTTLNIEIGVDENILGVSDFIQQTFFNMGFLGAIIPTILGSIAWHFVAGAFPLQSCPTRWCTFSYVGACSWNLLASARVPGSWA